MKESENNIHQLHSCLGLQNEHFDAGGTIFAISNLIFEICILDLLFEVCIRDLLSSISKM